MQKRTKLFLLILFCLVLFVSGVLVFLSPLLEQRRDRPQPPALPAIVKPGAQPVPSNVVPPEERAEGVSIVLSSKEANQSRALENRARLVVERIGSGSSESGFLGYGDTLSELTSAGTVALLAQQRQLQQRYPSTGPRVGFSTRAAASRLTEGKIGDAKIVVTVEAIQQQDDGNPSQPKRASAKRVIITFVKQSNGGYLIDGVTWEDVAL